MGLGRADPWGFVMLANPNRPNGGILSRFAGISPSGSPSTARRPRTPNRNNPLTTVTSPGSTTASRTSQPTRSTCSPFSTPFWAWPSCTRLQHRQETPLRQGQYQDTTTHDSDADRCPAIAAQGSFPHRSACGDGTGPVPPGAGGSRYSGRRVPAPNPPFYWYPLQTLMNLVAAIPVAIDNVLSYLAGNPDYRPLGTLSAVVNPYGPGGPLVDARPDRPHRAGRP